MQRWQRWVDEWLLGSERGHIKSRDTHHLQGFFLMHTQVPHQDTHMHTTPNVSDCLVIVQHHMDSDLSHVVINCLIILIKE